MYYFPYFLAALALDIPLYVSSIMLATVFSRESLWVEFYLEWLRYLWWEDGFKQIGEGFIWDVLIP